MIAHGLKEHNHQVVLGGNIGGSLLNQLDHLDDNTWIVLELSSAMLYWLDTNAVLQSRPPAIACITNCNENHIDWHGTYDHYEQSKRALANAVEDRRCILGESVSGWSSSDGVINNHPLDGCHIPGKHNAFNASMASKAIQLATDDPIDQIHNAVRSFQGLEHRLERVGRFNNIEFYNDSKCTVPNATLFAIDAIAERTDPSRIHLIAGGYDKGSDLSSISERSSSLAHLYTIGATAIDIAHGATGPCTISTTLDQGSVGLGTACASNLSPITQAIPPQRPKPEEYTPIYPISVSFDHSMGSIAKEVRLCGSLSPSSQH